MKYTSFGNMADFKSYLKCVVFDRSVSNIIGDDRMGLGSKAVKKNTDEGKPTSKSYSC